MGKRIFQTKLSFEKRERPIAKKKGENPNLKERKIASRTEALPQGETKTLRLREREKAGGSPRAP